MVDKLLDNLKEWCREHNVIIRYTFDNGIEIAEKIYADPLTDEQEPSQIYDANLVYIDGDGYIHQYERVANA